MNSIQPISNTKQHTADTVRMISDQLAMWMLAKNYEQKPIPYWLTGMCQSRKLLIADNSVMDVWTMAGLINSIGNTIEFLLPQ